MYRIKYSKQFVQEHIAAKVKSLREQGVINDQSVFLVMLSGGVWFATHLFDEIPDMLNEVYFIKGHSYHGKEHGSLHWDYLPNFNLNNRQVIVLDDICDSGNTTNAIYDALSHMAREVVFVTLLRRSTCQLEPHIKLHACIEDDSDDFFVGCGLDDLDRARMLPFVGIVEKN